MPVHIRESEIAAVMPEGELLMVEPELVQDRRMQVMHMDFVLDREVPEVVRFTIRESRLKPAARQQHGKPGGIVIAPSPVSMLCNPA